MNKKIIEKKNTQMSRIILNSIDIISLFLDDYKKREHGRSINKILNQSQKSISLKLSQLEDDNLFNSIKKGKIKDYYLNLKNPLLVHILSIAEEYKTIKFLMNKFPLLDFFDKSKNIIDGNIIIFGSYARGDFSKDSDLDLLILGKYNKIKIDKLSHLYPFKIHIIDMTKNQFEKGLFRKDNFMLEVIKNHIIIKGSSDLIHLFWRYYNDKH